MKRLRLTLWGVLMLNAGVASFLFYRYGSVGGLWRLPIGALDLAVAIRLGYQLGRYR